MKGIVYLIGAGPGNIGLMTVRGAELLKNAEVIVTDHLADERLLQWAPKTAECIYAGKTASHHTLKQHEINALLIEKAREGKRVVRLKGGDPFVFGRGGEEAAALHEAHIDFEIVPGISSAIAVPAYAGIPVTDRALASSFAVVTGHEDPSKTTSSIHWDTLSRAVDTLVFLMGIGNLPFITEQLMRNGKDGDTPAAFIRWGTRCDQKTVVTTVANAVADAKAHHIKPPAIFIVGSVVTRRQNLRWFDNRPLSGLTIGVTRAQSQASALVQELERLGAGCEEIPTITFDKPSDGYACLDKAIDVLAAYKWIVFTSVNGVDSFMKRLHKANKDSRALGKAKIAVIGPATAKALESYGITADIVPTSYRAESLVDALAPHIIPKTEVLLVRAEVARKIIPERLTAMGATVTVSPAYATRPAMETAQRLKHVLQEHRLQMITFTSSSTVTGLMTLIDGDRSLLDGITFACIGPITAQTCYDEGLHPVLVADTYTIPGLVNMITHRRHDFDEL